MPHGVSHESRHATLKTSYDMPLWGRQSKSDMRTSCHTEYMIISHCPHYESCCVIVSAQSRATHGGDHTDSKFWNSRLFSLPGNSFDLQALSLLTQKPVWNFGDLRENVFDIPGFLWKYVGNFDIWARAASAGALAPKPPRATRSTPEPTRTVHQKPFFPHFLELSHK